jgi:cyclopropane fatty-acyl-phospholipid synthase-like methyltransferase
VVAWHEDERFWSALRDGIFDAPRWERAQAEVHALLELAPVPQGGAVLDIPCGPGRHVMQLCARGLRVTGVDRSAAYLDEARARLLHAGAEAELVCADMRTFVRPEAFDLALNLYTSFGYFVDPRDDERFLRNVRASLRSDGRFVLELLTRETASAAPAGEVAHAASDGAQLSHSWRLLDGGRRLERRFAVERCGERQEHIASHRLYTAGELVLLLERAGFAQVALFGDFAGTPFGAASSYAVLVAR